ncbi:MBL fold metallo-hydrolase [Pseudoroseomonas globiformis]|uniref:MBL fold metallo-hydrolase n=1 Tax=Teichococcus globiformis TaxID=2307229 RepID=A0ABV7G254_9PROT
MPNFICATCGTSFPEASIPPARCPICEDERQYVPEGGQRWTTPGDLARGHSNGWRQLEPNLFELRTHPAFAIGQRAFLIRTTRGNVLWDCIALLDDATRALVGTLGGLAAIAISHPHYYTTMQDWAAAFDAPVYLHARDREWVMRPDTRLRFWHEEEHGIGEGLTLLRLGGHFPGGTVLHWRDGAGGGAVMAGDILQVAPGRKSVSFQWSYPNWMPLAGASVTRIAARLERWEFGRVYGAFGHNILEDGRAAVLRSAARYGELLRQDQP